MKSIGSLQHEFLSKLLLCNKRMTVKQALHRMEVLNRYVAKYYVMKGE